MLGPCQYMKHIIRQLYQQKEIFLPWKQHWLSKYLRKFNIKYFAVLADFLSYCLDGFA